MRNELDVMQSDSSDAGEPLVRRLARIRLSDEIIHRSDKAVNEIVATLSQMPSLAAVSLVLDAATRDDRVISFDDLCWLSEVLAPRLDVTCPSEAPSSIKT